MRQVTIRIEMRVSDQMNGFLLDEAHSKKLSLGSTGPGPIHRSAEAPANAL